MNRSTTTAEEIERTKAEIKAQIKSNMLFIQYGVIDEFRRQKWQKVKVLKTMPDGTKKWVRRPYWYLPEEQRPAPTNENEIA